MSEAVNPRYAEGITEEIALDHVTADEYEIILKELGRAPNLVGLGIFSVALLGVALFGFWAYQTHVQPRAD